MDEITSPIYVGRSPNPLAPGDITRGQGLFGGQGGLQNQLEMQGVDASALYGARSELGSGSVDIMPGQFFPGQVDYGTIPSDLIRDEIDETTFIRDFLTKFKDKLEGKDVSEYSEWIRVLGDYATGNAELSDLEAVDVSDLMDIEGFEDYYYGIVPRPLTEDTTTTETSTDAASQISDEEAISAVLASVPDKLKGLITKDNIIKVLEQVGQMNDPMTQIKKDMGAGIEIKWPGDWRNWKVFGPLAIPGVLLPPGIIDVTLGEIETAVQNAKEDIKGVIGSVGDFVKDMIEDPTGTLEGIGKKILETVEGVVSGAVDDPWGGTFGGFEDWVKGILGNVVGGSVLTGIYDTAKDLIETGTTAVVGGADTEDEEETTGDPTTRFAQLLGTVEDNLEVDPDLFGTADITAGGDITKDITNLLGGTIAQLDTTPVVDTTVGGSGDDITKTITTLLGGAINQLDTTPVVDTTPGGTTTTDIGNGTTTTDIGNGTTTTDIGNGTTTTDIGGGTTTTDIGGGTTTTDIGGGTTTTDIGGGTTTTDIGGYVDPENPPPIVIDPGGEDPSSSGGGGGAVGGTEGMFDEAMRGLSYMPQVLPGVRQAPPLDAMGSLNMLIDGLLTGRRA